MKKLTKIILLVLLSSALLNAEAFKVGVIAPLSGPIAEYGEATRNGIELAVSSNPKAFGNIEFVYEDSQYDTKVSLSAYRKLRQDANIKVIYNFGTNASRALLPISENESFPIVGLDFSNNSAVGSSYAVSFCNTSRDLGSKLAQYISSSSSTPKIAIIKNENSYYNDIIDGMNLEFGDTNPINSLTTISQTESNFRTIIAKLKSNNHDFLGVFLLPGQFSLFMQQMKALNYRIKIFGADTFDSKTEINKSGEAIEGAIYASFKCNDQFKSSYENQYKNDIQISYAAMAYEFANLTAQFFNDAKPDISANEIIKRYKTSAKHNGALGEFHYADSPLDGPRYRFPIYIKQIKGQNSVVLQ